MTIETADVIENWTDVTSDQMAAIGRPLAGQARGLTVDDIAELRRPFPYSQHKLITGFVYLEEAAIMPRIKSVDPSASVGRVEHDLDVFELGDGRIYQTTARLWLTIKGVTMVGVGSAEFKFRGKQFNEAKKNAATDALRRAARLHLVGAYLLSFPKNGNWERDGQGFLDRVHEKWAKHYERD